MKIHKPTKLTTKTKFVLSKYYLRSQISEKRLKNVLFSEVELKKSIITTVLNDKFVN